MLALEIALIGGIAIGVIYWQYQLAFPGGSWDMAQFDPEDLPNRVKIPFYVGMALFAGCIIYTIVTLSKGGNEHVPNLPRGIGLIIKSLVFWFFFIVKAYFGPIVLGIVLATVVYNLFEYGEFRSIPFFTWLADWVFGVASQTFHIIYVIVVGIYSFGASVIDEVDLS